MSTASVPPSHDVGPVHDVHRSPYPSAGTRPLATAPAIIPRKNGVINDELANTTPYSRASPSVAENLRKANVAPRSTMPNPASSHGTNSVVISALKAVGNAVHMNTRM